MICMPHHDHSVSECKPCSCRSCTVASASPRRYSWNRGPERHSHSSPVLWLNFVSDNSFVPRSAQQAVGGAAGGAGGAPGGGRARRERAQGPHPARRVGGHRHLPLRDRHRGVRGVELNVSSMMKLAVATRGRVKFVSGLRVRVWNQVTCKTLARDPDWCPDADQGVQGDSQHAVQPLCASWRQNVFRLCPIIGQLCSTEELGGEREPDTVRGTRAAAQRSDGTLVYGRRDAGRGFGLDTVKRLLMHTSPPPVLS